MSVIVAAARALAAFLGGFSLLNLLGALRTPGLDANLWWIDLRPFPQWFTSLALLAAAVLLLLFAARPQVPGWPREVMRWLFTALLGYALWNGIQYYVLIAHQVIHTRMLVPFSFLVSAALLIIVLAVYWKGPCVCGPLERMTMLLVFLACLIGFPLAQIACFGNVDYRRAADAIVVFGAGVYADGSPSRALTDRVQTACRLYQEHYAPRIIFSGGPGEGAVHETEAMRRMALRQGIPAHAILTDPNGVNTRATVQNTSVLFQRLHCTRILAVSHAYHLPRIKLTYQRAGWEVYTVPAEEPTPLLGERYFIVREVAALWAYYLVG